MKKYLFLILFLLISQPLFAYKFIYSPHTGRLDAVGVDTVSGDITAATGECTAGQVIEWNGTIFACAADDTSAGGGSIRVSEDGTFLVSADTLNFTTGLKATAVGDKITVSGDMATTTTPGIASFDTANFSVGTFGGVSIKSGGVNLADEVTGTLPGASFPALSGDVLTNAGSLITTIDVNSVALGTDTTGNYAAGDAEAGAALTGDSATSFFSTGTLEIARLDSDIPQTAFGITVDGGGSAITTGSKGFIQIPYDMTITRWTVLANASGSVSLDVTKSPYANFPTGFVSIDGTTIAPRLISEQASTDTTLTGWTTAVTEGDIIQVSVDSATTVQRVNAIFWGNKT